MAQFSVTFTIGAQSATRTINPGDARALEFLDDLIAQHYTDADPPLTRTQAGQRYVNELVNGVIGFAKGLKQRRLDAEVAEADDLTGTT